MFTAAAVDMINGQEGCIFFTATFAVIAISVEYFPLKFPNV
jgi:hypothetical protein